MRDQRVLGPERTHCEQLRVIVPDFPIEKLCVSGYDRAEETLASAGAANQDDDLEAAPLLELEALDAMLVVLDGRRLLDAIMQG